MRLWLVLEVVCFCTVVAVAVLTSGCTPAAAQGTAAGGSSATVAGKAKSQMCAVCHGPLGISATPDAPNLAGQPAIYLAAQLRAYRSGARQHEVMAVMAKPLTDDDIQNLAAWFAAIRIEAAPP